MRSVFSVVGLLAVVAIVGLIALQQLRATRGVAASGAGASAPEAGDVREQSQAVQRQIGADVAGSLQQSADRRADESTK